MTIEANLCFLIFLPAGESAQHKVSRIEEEEWQTSGAPMMVNSNNNGSLPSNVRFSER
jgi:hypothetical protein